MRRILLLAMIGCGGGNATPDDGYTGKRSGFFDTASVISWDPCGECGNVSIDWNETNVSWPDSITMKNNCTETDDVVLELNGTSAVGPIVFQSCDGDQVESEGDLALTWMLNEQTLGIASDTFMATYLGECSCTGLFILAMLGVPAE